MDRLHVATLNILNLADRWPERLPLLLADFAALQPDLIGMQEVVYVMQQDRIIGAAGEGHYAVLRGWAGRPEYGNSLLSASRCTRPSWTRLDLGIDRAIHRALFELPNGSLGRCSRSTHLHHLAAGGASDSSRRSGCSTGWRKSPEARRDGRRRRLQREPHGTDVLRGCWARVPVRVPRGERRRARRHLADRACRRPRWTSTGRRACLDYIWVRGAVEVESARLAFDRPRSRGPDAVPLGPLRASRAGSGSDDRRIRAPDAPARPSGRLAARAGEHDPGVGARAGHRRRATGWSSMSG